MTTYAFRSRQANKEGWAILPGATDGEPQRLVATAEDGAFADEDALLLHVYRRAAEGSFTHRAAVAHLRLFGVVGRMLDLAAAEGVTALPGDALVPIHGFAREAVEMSDGDWVAYSEEQVRRVFPAQAVKAGRAAVFRFTTIADPTRERTYVMNLFQGDPLVYAGVGEDGKPAFLDPLTGHVAPFVPGESSPSGAILSTHGKPLAPWGAHLVDVVRKAEAFGEDGLASLCRSLVAIAPECERGLVSVVTDAPAATTQEDAAAQVRTLRDARHAGGTHPALASADRVSQANQAAEAAAAARAARAENHGAQDPDEADESYDDDGDDVEVVLASAVPVLDIPQFMDPALRAQAQSWLEPGMGAGFRIENASAIVEAAEESPTIDALVEAMGSGTTIVYPGVSHHGYATSEMTSLDDGRFRAVVFSDFMGRYAYVTPSEGLAPRVAPGASLRP